MCAFDLSYEGESAAILELELELELIQTHMAQKPVLRVEVGARALRVRSVSREEAWASAGVQGAWWVGVGVKLTVHDAFGEYP